MNHKRFKEWMVLAIANEIGDDEMAGLMEHVRHCDGCRSEFNELKRLKDTLTEAGAAEPTDQLLSDARRSLRHALRRESVATRSAARRAQWNESSSWARWFPRFRLAFSGLAAVAAGVLIGYVTFGADGSGKPPTVTEPIAEVNGDHEMGPSRIANVRFVHANPRDREIEVAYDLVRPVRLRADVDDERMQRMLAYALVNERNPGVRLQAISALDGANPADQDEDIKAALITALKSDSNDGVRKHALAYLYTLPFDDNIKDACLFVLTHDDNPGLRIAAINILAAAKLDGFVVGDEVYDALESELKSGDDDYLRSRSGAFIQEVNDVR